MKTILVVEDEYDLMITLSTILEGEGYATRAGFDGKEALERLRSDRPPDLVLMDVMLPQLGGREVARIMRETPGLERVPIVLMSAIPPREPEGGPPGTFLLKPFSLSTLLETVEGLIGKPDNRAAGR